MHAATATPDYDHILKRFSPLVTRIARHLVAKLPASVELDDIVQAGMMGLMDAASRYQPDQGTQFETFAAQRVRGAMLDELRQNDWAPRGVRKNQRRIEAAIGALAQRLGRAPRETEIAGELGVTLSGYQRMLGEAKGLQIFSFDDVEDEGDESGFARHPAAPGADPAAQLEDKRFRAALVESIDALPERERVLMGLYYEQDLNFREIAAILGVTESRVCQLHTQAIARLRARMNG